MRNRFRNRFLSCLLPAVLLFAQQTAMAHLASHAAGESPGPESLLTHVKLCNKCLSVEKLTSAAVEAGHRPGVVQHAFHHAATSPTRLRSHHAVLQSCRDPPTSA